jgi:ABC-type polysaccharide/polyol phosphate export permease
MITEIRRLFSIMKRDLLTALTYKLAFASAYIGLAMQLFLFIYFIKMFEAGVLPVLAAYGGDPIAYVMVGAAGWAYLWTCINAASTAIKTEMSRGTFEYIFLTPVSPYTLIASYTIRSIFMSSILIVFYLAIGFGVFHVQLQGNYVLAFLIMGLSILTMAGLGLAIAGLKIYYKSLGTFILILQTVAMFFSNVYFDISVLPSFLRPVAYIFPTYYSITSLKIALLSEGKFPSFLNSYMIILLTMCAASFVVGKFIFWRSFNKARKDGALAYY